MSHHPNGAVAAYTLANGVAYSATQNLRGLPERIRHAGIAQDAYAYDANGNVTAITDEQEGLNHRSLGYDGLDRLIWANGPWGAGSYSYDALDNIRTSTVGSRSLTHAYDSATNRLSGLSGSQSITIGYDANGNISQRGAQSFVFDIGNRMTAAPGKIAGALYDGHGRRNAVWYDNGDFQHRAYTHDGLVRFGWRNSEGHTRHVYLGRTLIAEQSEDWTKTYAHTDALGSPIARSNSPGALISRTRYEPYGATVAGSTNPTRIGFTGHVNDAETGLVYMQQRYYEPIAGRFLSVDPVVTNWNSGESFNRYVYAENNPHRYTDPDGRNPTALQLVGTGAFRVASAMGARALGSWLGIKLYDVLHQEGNSGDEASDAAVKGLTSGLESGGQKGIYVDPNGNAADALDSLPGEAGENGQKTLPDGSVAGVHTSTTTGARTVHIHRPAGKRDIKIRYPNDKQKEEETEKAKEEKPKEEPK